MRASCQGRSSLGGGAGLSASTPLASPSDAPIAIPTLSIQTLRDLVIIKPQHTCGGDSPLAAERRHFSEDGIEEAGGRGKARVQRQVVNHIVQRQWFADEKALAIVHAQLCGARTDRVSVEVAGHGFEAKGVR